MGTPYRKIEKPSDMKEKTVPSVSRKKKRERGEPSPAEGGEVRFPSVEREKG